MSWVVSSDTGGTFTDLVALSDEGELRIAKVPSTHPDLDRGVIHGLRELAVPMAEVRMLFHASTVATNAAITRSGAKTGLITTRGFRDILELRRVDRKDLYDVLWDPPEPLIRRRDRLEVRERVNYAGQIVEPLDEDEVRAIARTFRRRGIEAVAVVLINAYAEPAHERRIAEILADEIPGIAVSISTEVLPEPPEFERTATTVANAYLAPVLTGYMSRLTDAALSEGYAGRFVLVMHNAGGTMTSDYAKGVPVRTLNSGPAGGAIAGAAIARNLDRPNVVCLDMGGTSADVALVLGGEVLLTNNTEAEWGLPIRFPAVDVTSVGAGGGSIAWIDSAGVLKVGPQSAGSSPGPACYGRGGSDPTVTDANVVMGKLGTDVPLGGDLHLRADLAEAAIHDGVAKPLGIPVSRAAEAIIRIANSNMSRPVRLVTVERGYDPRSFSLIVFGGAGPLHGVDVALDLGIPEVIVPAHPGVTSAIGVLSVPPVDDFSAAVDRLLDGLDHVAVMAKFVEIESRVLENLQGHGVPREEIRIEYSVDFRYVGQLHSLIVPLVKVDECGFQEARHAFDAAHERQYRYSHPEWGVELATIRVSAQGKRQASGTSYSAVSQRTGHERRRRTVRFPTSDEAVETDVIDRSTIRPGETLRGPLIIEQVDSTIVIPPDMRAVCESTGDITIKVSS